MKPEEIKTAIKYLGGLFPGQLTQEQGRYLGKSLAPFTAKAVTEAINAHRATHAKVETSHLIEACRAEERRAKDSTNNTRNEGSWCDVRRRMQPQLAGKSDVEVALRVHRQWLVCGGENYEAGFLAQCRNQLAAIGLPIPDVDRYAETILLDPESFRQVLQDIRDNPPAIVKSEEAVTA